MTEFFVKKDLKNQHNFRIHFIKCGCNQEILVVNYDAECDLLDVSIYENIGSFKHKLSWYQKIRYIWHILTHPYPYTDQIVLERNQINELKAFFHTI